MGKGVSKMNMNLLRNINKGLSTNDKSKCEVTEEFSIKNNVHQGSTLTSYLFYVVIDEVTKKIKSEKQS